MPFTNAPGGLTSFGVPVIPGVPAPFTGNYFFCDPVNGNDGYEGNNPKRAVKTLYRALQLCTSGNNDVVILMNNGLDSGSAVLSLANAQSVDPTATSGVLNWNKNATHLIGLGIPSNYSRSRIAPPSGTYTQATFGSGNFVVVTGAGCLFMNLSIFHGFSTGGTNQIAWTDSGGRNSYINCGFFGASDAASAADTGSRSLKINTTGENSFTNCIIGGDIIGRSVANASLELAGGTFRNSFESCFFPFLATNAAVLGILGTGANCINRWTTFDNCSFVNSVKSTGGTTMTALASFTNATPGGLLNFKDCPAIGITKYGDANALANSFINMSAPSAAAGGLAVPPQ